ncbi:MAG: hypothetical protein M1831_001775 [Alyxoria varia]|nr:MAG: hypothetical protein M1831_001775 [Alyxoria varia]
MHVQLALDAPNMVFTNLDFIRGRVILNLPSTTPITSILVKLEGESRTMLWIPARNEPGERPRPVSEAHRILYKVSTVMPTANMPGYHGGRAVLPPGNYEYPFEFKVPFNNSCHASSQAPKGLNIGPLSIEGPSKTATPSSHIRTTLPPTLTSFPAKAEIFYFLKVTVNRKEFYKENPRVIQRFTFLPIEPPRPAPTSAETYARRRHHFTPYNASSKSSQPAQKMKRMLTGMSSKVHTSSSDSSTAKTSGKAPAAGKTGSLTSDSTTPEIALDARLPNPAILTCNEKIPLRMMVKCVNGCREQLHLQSLQVELVGYTHIRAGGVHSEEVSNWIIVSRSNMGQLLHMVPGEQQEKPQQPARKGSIPPAAGQIKDDDVAPPTPLERDDTGNDGPSFPTTTKKTPTDDTKSKEPATPRPSSATATEPTCTIPTHFWSSDPLPPSVSPTFSSCNITRRYDLEIRVGIGYGASSQKNMVVLPLRVPVTVHSGVHPPAELVQAMSLRAQQQQQQAQQDEKPGAAGAGKGKGVGITKKPLTKEARDNVAAAQHASASSSAPSAAAAGPSSGFAGAYGAQQPVYAPLPPGEEEPPPSYEDAIGLDMSPIDGPRHYQPPPLAEREGFGVGEGADEEDEGAGRGEFRDRLGVGKGR